jgi:chromosome segregation ATPase
MTAAHNFAMLKQGLEDAMKASNKELAESKKAKAKAEEAKAEAEGELERTNTELAADETRLKDLQHECMTKAEEYDLQSRETAAELEALAAAKKIIKEKTGAAASRTYGDDEAAASFVQLSASSKARQLADKLTGLLQGLAKREKQTELAQLALKIRSVMTSNADPFKKVKGMIQEMVEKLVKEAEEEAGHKAFCDKEMSETKAKMEDKQGEVDDLNTSKDKFEAKIAKLTESIATLEAELADIAAAQKTANEMRAEEKAAWTDGKSDFEQGLEGVQMALQVLRDYYAEKDSAASLVQTNDDGDIKTQMALMQSQASKSTGSASGIIGMLEVAESDFSKMLSEGQAAEDQLQKEYEKVTEDNRIASAKKDTEKKYSAKDLKETGALLADTKDDLGVSQEELSAILEYWEKLQPQCVAKPEPYEERKARREREIAGLKEALTILEEESAPAFLAVRTA